MLYALQSPGLHSFYIGFLAPLPAPLLAFKMKTPRAFLCAAAALLVGVITPTQAWELADSCQDNNWPVILGNVVRESLAIAHYASARAVDSPHPFPEGDKREDTLAMDMLGFNSPNDESDLTTTSSTTPCTMGSWRYHVASACPLQADLRGQWSSSS